MDNHTALIRPTLFASVKLPRELTEIILDYVRRVNKGLYKQCNIWKVSIDETHLFMMKLNIYIFGSEVSDNHYEGEVDVIRTDMLNFKLIMNGIQYDFCQGENFGPDLLFTGDRSVAMIKFL